MPPIASQFSPAELLGWSTPPPRARLCPGKAAPSFGGPKLNWYQPLPEFWLPYDWAWDPLRWPDYKEEFIASRLEDLDEFGELFRLRGFGDPDPRAWGAWLGSFGCDRPLKRGWPALEVIADRMYDTARYKALVPAWRRQMTEWITYLDNIEDQISTILWLIEMLGRKVAPIPPGALNLADDVRKYLDAAEKALALTPGGRTGKVEWRKRQQEAARQKREARSRIAMLMVWVRQNYTKLIEAAQATGTWFDVGIILGPIMGWIDEGIWGLAEKTLDNYLIAADVLAPGYREDFYRNATELEERVDLALINLVEGVMTTELFGYSLETLFRDE